MERCTASTLVTTATSAASSTTCVTRTWSRCASSCCIRTCDSPALPSSAPGTSWMGRSWGEELSSHVIINCLGHFTAFGVVNYKRLSLGLITETGSGTLRASISPVSADRRSANTRPRPSPWSRAGWPGWKPAQNREPTVGWPCWETLKTLALRMNALEFTRTHSTLGKSFVCFTFSVCQFRCCYVFSFYLKSSFFSHFIMSTIIEVTTIMLKSCNLFALEVL